LRKGFLKPQNNLSLTKKRLIWGVLLGLTFSFLCYGATSYFFEFCRRTSSLHCGAVYPFTEEERSFYLWFYAALAFIFGQNFTFWYWATRQSRLNSKNSNLSLRLKNIANDQSSISTYTIHWLSKLAALYFVFFGVTVISPTYDYVDLYRNYGYLFILIAIVLWLQTWTSISRLFKRKATKWMLLSAVIIFGGSFLLSQISLMDHQAWDKEYKDQNLLYQYEVQLPECDFSQTLEKHSRLVEFTIGYSKENLASNPSIMYNNTVIDMELIPNKIIEAYSLKDEREIPFTTVKITADRRIPMSFINRVKQQIKRANVYKTAFATRLEDIPFHNKHLPITNRGIMQSLKPSDTIDFIDSVAFYTPPPTRYQPCAECYSNQNDIHLASDGKVSINDSAISMLDLNQVLVKSLKKNPDYHLELTYDSDVTLETYLAAHSAIRSYIYSLRDEMSRKYYDKPYNELRDSYDLKRKRHIQKEFPLKIEDLQSP